MADALKLLPGASCDRCGAYGAFDLGDRRLCEDCYRSLGSCCVEFGADDLWRRGAAEPKKASGSR